MTEAEAMINSRHQVPIHQVPMKEEINTVRKDGDLFNMPQRKFGQDEEKYLQQVCKLG